MYMVYLSNELWIALIDCLIHQSLTLNAIWTFSISEANELFG